MHRPVLVTPPAILPISVAEVKQALHIDAADDDVVIEREIRAAVAHYEGWTGILGICLVEQTWRQDFDNFDCLRLPLGPVIPPVVAVRWRNTAGQIATINASEYSLQTDGAGRSFLRFRNGYTRPSDLYETGAVQVEYKAGWPVVEGASTVPDDIRTAIIFRVQLAYDEAAKTGGEHLARAENALISKYRRFSI
ncbi:hypothetical protein [Chelativorans sp.]|uniref:head-tail connector protein n=1 Tax=Chelativorans sp. TaxID=2203393 RepID=UPI00281175A5|nr:hypothetical protein [Chelativorans sp.]